jgi:hypothetical protein
MLKIRAESKMSYRTFASPMNFKAWPVLLGHAGAASMTKFYGGIVYDLITQDMAKLKPDVDHRLNARRHLIY